jgi:GTP-binding protein YchF
MKLGIIGLPQAGKTTIFNALTGGNTPVGQMAGGGRFEINQATVDVPDVRLDWLTALYKPKRTVRTQINYADIAGLQGSKSSFSGPLLNALAQMDGLIQVVRAFQNEQVPHASLSVNAGRDLSAVDDELLLNDLVTVEKRVEKLDQELKRGGARDKKEVERELEAFKAMADALNAGTPLRNIGFSYEEVRRYWGFNLLTIKPMLVVLNTGDDPESPADVLRGDYGIHDPAHVIAMRGKIEMEIAQLPPDEAAMFIEEYALGEPSLSRLIGISYQLLGLQSFFTVGEDEVRAWTVRAGASAPEAAGRIHSDLQAGFIRAEVFPYAALHDLGNETAVKAAGKWGLQGKDYIVQDGDILNIRFSPPKK